MDDGQTGEAHDDSVALRVREEIARRRISRQALADMARISLSTLEKALAGRRPFSLATRIRLEEALGTRLAFHAEAQSIVAEPLSPLAPAPESMGAYTRAAVRWIEGGYLTLRPAFSEPGSLYAYRTTIGWDDAAGHLVFAESARQDPQFAQTGHVSMPNLSGHIYLVTNDSGQYRLVMLGRATREGRLFGILTTLQVGSGSQLVPLACPVALVPMAQMPDAPIGIIAPGSARHDACRALLDIATGQDFARFRH